MANSGKAPLTFNLNKIPEKQAGVIKETAEETQAKKTLRKKAAAREGRQFAAVHVKPEVIKQLKMLGIQQDKTIQSLMVEAINELFQKYGVSRIAD